MTAPESRERFRQALIASRRGRYYEHNYPERFAGEILAILDRAGLVVVGAKPR